MFAEDAEEALFPIFVRSGRRSDQYRAGFINAKGEVIVEPNYECTGPFREGLGSVQIGMKWGFVDSVGRIVIEPFSGGETSFREGKAVFSVGGKCGVINRAGHTRVPGHPNLGHTVFLIRTRMSRSPSSLTMFEASVKDWLPPSLVENLAISTQPGGLPFPPPSISRFHFPKALHA